MQKLSSFMLKLLTTVFYALALFIIAAEIFPVAFYDAFESYHKFITKTLTRTEISIESLNKKEEFKTKYGILDSAKSIVDIDDIAFEIDCDEYFKEHKRIHFTIESFFNDFEEPTLTIHTCGFWKQVKSKILTNENVELKRYVSFQKNDESHTLYKFRREYAINDLPPGWYKLSFSLFDKTVTTFFNVTKNSKIKAKWTINKADISDSSNISIKLNPRVDTKWLYIGPEESPNPYIEWNMRTTKNGVWESLGSNSDYSCYGEIERASANKSELIFRHYNIFFKLFIDIYDTYLYRNNIVDSTFSIEDYWYSSKGPKDIRFAYSKTFENSLNNVIGDSLSIRFSLIMFPMPWSNYNTQTIDSDYYTFRTEEVLAGFKNYLERIRRKD